MPATVRWYHTLAWKFFLRTALAILLLVGTLLAVAYDQAQKGARRAATDGLLSAAQVLDRTFEQQGRVLDAQLEVFVQFSPHVGLIEQGDPASIRDILMNNLGKLQAELAVVVQPSAHLLSCTTDMFKQDYSDTALANLALDPAGAAAAGRPGPSYRGFVELPGGAFKGVYHAVSRPVLAPGGGSLGAMLVGTKLDDKAAADLRKLAIAPPREKFPAAHLAILSRGRMAGVTLDPAHRDQLERLLGDAPDLQAARGAVRSGKRSEPQRLMLNNEPYLVLLSPLRGEDGSTLEMATALLMPMAPFLAPFRTLQLYILCAGAAGLLGALLLALRSARAVTRPLQNLTDATALLAEGERPEIPRLDTQDEVGYLTQAFRALLSELKAKDDLLAALDQVRGNHPSLAGELDALSGTRASLTAVDVDATVLVPSASQVVAGAVPVPQRKRITLREGEVFAGRYRIEAILGKGGMGLVLRVHDQQLDEDVALKVIRPEHDVDATFLDQLKQELKLARRISHRYVLRTHDFGEAEGIPFVTMEYLKGVTLRQLLDDRGFLPLPLVLRIGRQVAEGLEAAHAEGVVHRDIKPLNVLFDTRGDAKLMDFGLAAPVAARGTSDEGQVFGTPRYMAPEQVRGERVDPRTDLYALGVMLYELATGAPPFNAPGGVAELLRLHLNAPVPDARELSPNLPASFAALVQRLMAKRMEERPASAAEVVETLKLIAAGGDSDTRRG